MKLEIKHPILTRGQPRRCSSERDIYVTAKVMTDVPEITATDTEIAFRAYHRFSPRRGGGSHFDRIEHQTLLRSWEGKLYRRIGRVQEVKERGWTTAFPNVIGDNSAEGGTDICQPYQGTCNPVSAALVRQFDWELERGSVDDSRVVTAWPTSAKGMTRHGAREITDLAEVLLQMDNHDEAATERSMDMLAVQSRRVALIDREIWMTCRAPGWRVQISHDRNDCRATISLAHAFDGFDPVLSRRHFALDDLEGAKEYAALCIRKTPSEILQWDSVELLPDYEVIDPDAVAHDPADEELARIGYALASECHRYSLKNKAWMSGLDGRLRDTLHEAMLKVEETNYVLDRFGDITPYVEDLVTIWKDFKRPSAFCEVGLARGRFGDMLIKRARSLAENAPINLGSSAAFGTPMPPVL